MKTQTRFNQRFVVSLVTTIIGAISMAPVSAALAQPTRFQVVPQMLARSPLLQGNWRLANMTEPPFPTPMVPDRDLTAEFSNGRVSGTGGCNRFNGSYTTKGNQLTVGPLASTFKACEESVMTQETRFLKAMQAAQRYEVSRDGLQIFYKTDQGTGVLRFTSLTVRGLW